LRYNTVVIGAGPAGLATSRELTRAGTDHVVCERGTDVAHTWSRLYDSLVLHTGKHLSSLPGLSMPRGTPLFPSRAEFVRYLQGYAARFQLPVRTNTEVVAVERSQDGWRVRTASGETVDAHALVVATGIVSNPHVPEIAGARGFRGRILHSVEYRDPQPFVGRRVLLVGAGNSAGEIGAELAAAGAHVTIAVRSGRRAVPRQILGVPIQYVAVVLGRVPRPVQRKITAILSRASEKIRGRSGLPAPVESNCPDVPLIGFHLTDAIRSGTIALRGGVHELTETGAKFAAGTEQPFDDVIFATGYRAALAPLGSLIRRDECGFARRVDRVASADQPDLYFVGHNYDVRGALLNISRDARTVAERIHAAHRV
jgi:cation diffusion facilitator CzcD-associated flavoprotein CzcO